MKNRLHKGFTLIELLIVIALLGALAVGLIGALDPFEQLKKGTDTGTRDLVSQVQTAIIRYYSIKNAFPWTTDPSSEALNGTNMSTAIANLIAAGELKSTFNDINQNNLIKVWTTGDSINNSVAVCYQPTSKSFLADPNTKYKKDGTAETDCKGETPPGTKSCYWCVQ